METERNRQNDEPAGNGGFGEPGANLQRYRRQIGDTINQGRRYSQRAIGRNSLEFNRAVQQTGAQ